MFLIFVQKKMSLLLKNRKQIGKKTGKDDQLDDLDKRFQIALSRTNELLKNPKLSTSEKAKLKQKLEEVQRKKQMAENSQIKTNQTNQKIGLNENINQNATFTKNTQKTNQNELSPQKPKLRNAYKPSNFKNIQEFSSSSSTFDEDNFQQPKNYNEKEKNQHQKTQIPILKRDNQKITEKSNNAQENEQKNYPKKQNQIKNEQKNNQRNKEKINQNKTEKPPQKLHPYVELPKEIKERIKSPSETKMTITEASYPSKSIETISNESTEIKEYKEIIIQLQNDLKSQKNENEQLKHENEELLRSLELTTQENIQYKISANCTAERLQRLENSSQEIAISKLQIQELRQVMEGCEADCQALEVENKRLTDLTNKQLEDIEYYVQKNEEYESLIEKMKKEIRHYKQTIKQNTANDNKQQNTNEKEIEKLQNELKQKDQKIAELNAKYQKMEKYAKKLENEIKKKNQNEKSQKLNKRKLDAISEVLTKSKEILFDDTDNNDSLYSPVHSFSANDVSLHTNTQNTGKIKGEKGEAFDILAEVETDESSSESLSIPKQNNNNNSMKIVPISDDSLYDIPQID